MIALTVTEYATSHTGELPHTGSDLTLPLYILAITVLSAAVCLIADHWMKEEE